MNREKTQINAFEEDIAMMKKELFQIHDYTLGFAVDYPDDFAEDVKHPVIFYFHGMGGVHQGVDYIMERCPLKRENIPMDIPGGVAPILVIPSCPDDMWFVHFSQVVDFIKSIIAREYVDATRIYLTGSSMGGYTCWMLSMLHHDLFAGAAICCGGGPYWAAPWIDFPVRAYHGKLDTTVYPRESQTLVEWIKGSGGRAELFLYDGVGHDAWNYAYTDPQTFYWLLAQRRADK